MFLFFRGLFQSASLGHFHLYLFHYKELENGTSKVSVWFCKNLRSSKLATKVAFEWAFFLIQAFLRGFFHKCCKLSSFHFPQQLSHVSIINALILNTSLQFQLPFHKICSFLANVFNLELIFIVSYTRESSTF